MVAGELSVGDIPELSRTLAGLSDVETANG